jgi:hypothetical protein
MPTSAASFERVLAGKLVAASVLRIHQGMRSGRDTALQGTHAEITAAYDDVLLRGDTVVAVLAAAPKANPNPLPIDRAIDRVISGLEDVFNGLQKIFDPEGAVALTETERGIAHGVSALKQLSFPEGISFVIRPWREEWAEIQQVLGRLKAPTTTLRLEGIDFTLMVERLQRCQDEYGRALGIDYKGTNLGDLQAALDAWEEAMSWLNDAVGYHHRSTASEIRARIFGAYFAEQESLAAARARSRTGKEAAGEKPSDSEKPA